MLSETDVEPKAINGMGLDGRKSLGRAMLRAPLVLIIILTSAFLSTLTRLDIEYLPFN